MQRLRAVSGCEKCRSESCPERSGSQRWNLFLVSAHCFLPGYRIKSKNVINLYKCKKWKTLQHITTQHLQHLPHWQTKHRQHRLPWHKYHVLRVCPRRWKEKHPGALKLQGAPWKPKKGATRHSSAILFLFVLWMALNGTGFRSQIARNCKTTSA